MILNYTVYIKFFFDIVPSYALVIDFYELKELNIIGSNNYKTVRELYKATIKHPPTMLHYHLQVAKDKRVSKRNTFERDYIRRKYPKQNGL